ncbi:MAG: hypothetical protein AAF550_09680 [Myxococcota bacterium]
MREEQGAVLVVGAFSAVLLAALLLSLLALAESIAGKESAQRAVDVAAQNAAGWTARGLNAVAFLNVVGVSLVAVGTALKASWFALSVALVTAIGRCDASRPAQWAFCLGMLQIPLAMSTLSDHLEPTDVLIEELVQVTRDAQDAVAVAIPVATETYVARAALRFSARDPGRASACLLNPSHRLPVMHREVTESCGLDLSLLTRVGHLEALQQTPGIADVPELIEVVKGYGQTTDWLAKSLCHREAYLAEGTRGIAHRVALFDGPSERTLPWNVFRSASFVERASGLSRMTLAHAEARPVLRGSEPRWLWHASFDARLSRFRVPPEGTLAGSCIPQSVGLSEFDLDAAVVH